MQSMFRKCTAILLAVVLSFSAMAFAIPVLAAEKTPVGTTPIVYIIGRTGIVTAEGQGTIIEDPSYITDVVKECIPYLKDALLYDKWDEYCDAIYNLIAPRYATYKLNDDGEVDNGTHINWGWNYDSLPAEQDYNNMYTYKFEYDARRNPCDIADDMHAYIEAIKQKTGHDKVYLVSRCLGCNMAMAYLTEYGYDSVESNVMFASAATGYAFVGEMFAGKMSFDAASLNYFMTEYLDDSTLNTLIKASIALADKTGVLDAGTMAANMIYQKVYENVLPRLLVATFATCPGYWSMVNDANYEDAKALIFGEEATTTYKNLVAKIDTYHYDVQQNIKPMLIEMKSNGVKMGIICKYGFQVLPVIESSNLVGDNRIEVYEQSLGANTAPMGETFSWLYMQKAKRNGTAKYISPDKQIDSSTALFPDNTWYIKNIVHNPFYDCFNPLMMAICRADGQMTVESNQAFPQYLFYKDGNVSPLTAENMNTYSYTTDLFTALIRFYKALFAFLRERFSIR